MIKAVVFDVGRVLHGRTSKYIYDDVMRTLDIPENVFKKYWDPIEDKLGKGLITEDKFWKSFIQKSKSIKPLPRESLWLREFIKHYKINNAVLNIVHKLKTNGYKVAILSNSVKPHADYQYSIGLYQQFDVVVLSHEVGLKKPDQAIFKLLLNRLKLDADEVSFIDDETKNINAASKIGIHAILFENAKQLQEDLIKLGVNI